MTRYQILSIFVVLFLVGCSASEQTTLPTGDERFATAKKLFDDEDYLEAINEFTAITLQYQGGAFADDAQFYLGECRFERGEFLLAAFEYQQLKRSYAASPLVADAQFKLGLCYYNLSPPSNLEQQYTHKAIDELQTFVEYNPSHPKAVEAENLIKELTNRLAKKSFEIASQYVVLEQYRSAIFYFDDVIERYHDTEYAPQAFIGKIEALMARKRHADAEIQVKEFLSRYPNSVLRSRVLELQKAIDRHFGRSSGVSSKDSGIESGSTVSSGNR